MPYELKEDYPYIADHLFQFSIGDAGKRGDVILELEDGRMFQFSIGDVQVRPSHEDVDLRQVSILYLRCKTVSKRFVKAMLIDDRFQFSI